MADLLIEIICEEIPARMQARAAADLERLITGKLDEAGLKHGAARHFVAPRHLALYVGPSGRRTCPKSVAARVQTRPNRQSPVS
jgi:glycyl-tRNA synthetase beta subunit